jgi:very-short-patch-repair endonuclease
VSSTSPEQWEIPETLRRRMVELARQLRQNQTPTETELWQHLRRKQRGYKVRRQQPIGPFVVDFYISQARLVIEVDGSIHDHQKDYDQQRQALLEELGMRLLRFTTAAVERNLSMVLTEIDQAVEALSTPKIS